jgi:carbamoyltransferase
MEMSESLADSVIREIREETGSRALYMVGAAPVSAHGQEVMPAATHVDATARPQVLPSGAAPVVESILRHLQQAGLPRSW